MGRSWLENGEPLWCDPAMVLPEWLVNVLEQEVSGAADGEDVAEIVEYSKDRNTVKPVLSGHYKRRLKADYHLMQVKSIAECSKGSILQYFRPSLRNHLSLRSLFCLFLSGRLRQV